MPVVTRSMKKKKQTGTQDQASVPSPRRVVASQSILLSPTPKLSGLRSSVEVENFNRALSELYFFLTQEKEVLLCWEAAWEAIGGEDLEGESYVEKQPVRRLQWGVKGTRKRAWEKECHLRCEVLFWGIKIVRGEALPVEIWGMVVKELTRGMRKG